MKMIFKKLLPGVALAFLLALPALAENRIATIDMGKVFDKYWKREQAQASLKQKGDELDKDYKALMEDYKKVQEDYVKLRDSSNDQSVTPDEREKRKNQAEDKLREIKTSENTLRAFQTKATDELETQKKRMRDTLLQYIRAAINAKAKSGNYTMVMDSSAESVNGTPMLLYTNGENDITEAVLSQ